MSWPLSSWFKLLYGSFGQSNMHGTLDICPYILVRKESNPPKLRVNCPNVYAVLTNLLYACCHYGCIDAQVNFSDPQLIALFLRLVGVKRVETFSCFESVKFRTVQKFRLVKCYQSTFLVLKVY